MVPNVIHPFAFASGRTGWDTFEHPPHGASSTGAPIGLRGAIGYIDSSLPGWPDNEVSVQKHALQRDYRLVRLVLYYGVVVEDSSSRLLSVVRGYSVDVIITPDLGHIGEPELFREICNIETVFPSTVCLRARISGRHER
ncbi:hypothetical protein ABIA39_000511 [Nocardia sp. GAS34]